MGPRAKGLNAKTFINREGERIGYLTVLCLDKYMEYKYKKQQRVPMWKCICKCGKIFISRNARKGKSCGCTNLKNRDGYRLISGNYFWTIKNGAKIRNIDFSITKEDLWNRLAYQSGRCSLTGEILCMDTGGNQERQTGSIDRVDSNIGYATYNIQWLHKDINKIKIDFTDNEFIEICKIVTNNWFKTNYETKNPLKIKDGIYDEKINNEYSERGINKNYLTELKRGATRADRKYRNKLTFDLTIQDIYNQYVKQDGKCHFSGIKIFFGTGYSNGRLHQTASVDRLDALKGYTKENIIITHKYINHMRWDFSEEEFINLCLKVAKFNENNSCLSLKEELLLIDSILYLKEKSIPKDIKNGYRDNEIMILNKKKETIMEIIE